MGKFQDLTGLQFGYLIVLCLAYKKPRKRGGYRYYWWCLCDCGRLCVVNGESLKSGKQISCGCHKLKKLIERSTKHGMRHTKIYHTWQDIKNRCYNPHHKDYLNYGGRGITMFAAWINDFQAFYDYVSTLEHFNEDGYTLDRIKNGGNYEPGNVRWADRKTQNRNTRKNVMVEYEGVEMCLAEAAEKSGINYACLRSRYYSGKRGDDLFVPLKKQDIFVEYQGVEMTLLEAAEKSGIAYTTLKSRYHAGKRGEKLFAPVDERFSRKKS